MAENTIESLLEEKRIFDPPSEFSKKAYIKSLEEYKQIYERSISEPELFWAQQAQQLEWFKKWDKVHYWDAKNAICRWFEGGKLNVSFNCLDRHLATHGDRIAIKWESDGGESQSFTYNIFPVETKGYDLFLFNTAIHSFFLKILAYYI